MSVLTLPSTRSEAWRWADTAAIAAAAGLPRLTPEPVELWLDLPGDRLLFVDGELHPSSTLVRAEAARVAASDHPLGQRTAGQGWRLSLSG